MLTIEYHDTVKTVICNDMFSQLNFSSDVKESDVSGDSYLENLWGIEVLSLDGYYPVEGFRWTKPEKQVKLTYLKSDNTIGYLQCSPEHILLKINDVNTWEKVENMSPGDSIVTASGVKKIMKIENVNELDRLCDLQVAIAHSYFANDVFSHNSHFLTFLGAAALRSGVDVLHYTFELSEAAVGLRYDSNLCDLDSNKVIDNKDSVLEKYKDMKLGRLIIKEFPTNTCSIYTIRAHIERLEVKGFRPGLIVIDYADIMRSTRQYDSLRHELKLVYEELRGFASEKAVPIWTASQSNKEGAANDIVDLGNMSEAYGKAMVADVVLSISRRAHEKSSGAGRLYVAKNRAGRDGLVFPIRIDTARSNFEILGEAGSLDTAIKQDESEVKRALREKWNELKNDPVIGNHMKKSSGGDEEK